METKKKIKYFAGIEAGGSHFVAVIGVEIYNNEIDDDDDDGIGELKIVESQSFDTKAPKETLEMVGDWLALKKKKYGDFSGVGIASFGPLDLNRKSKTFGFITTTPKPNWGNIDIVGSIVKSLDLDDCGCGSPVGFDTDVNAAALNELMVYNQIRKNCSNLNCAYITVGTGVGVGLVVNGSPIHGMLHPELGHVLVPRMENDSFKGSCPFHGDCVEGLCAAGSIADRLEIDKKELVNVKDSHSVWDSVAFYLAHLCANITLSISPSFIVFGGGVSQRKVVIEKIRHYLPLFLANYIKTKEIQDMNSFIFRSSFEMSSGILGSLRLAIMASKN